MLCLALRFVPSRGGVGVGAAVIDYDNHDADVAKSCEGGSRHNTRARSLCREKEGRKKERGNGMASWRERRVGLTERVRGRETGVEAWETGRGWLGRNRVFPRLFTFGLDVVEECIRSHHREMSFEPWIVSALCTADQIFFAHIAGHENNSSHICFLLQINIILYRRRRV